MNRKRVRVFLNALLAVMFVFGVLGMAGCGNAQGQTEAEGMDQTAGAGDGTGAEEGLDAEGGQEPGDVMDAEDEGKKNENGLDAVEGGQEPGKVTDTKDEGEKPENGPDAADDGQKPGDADGPVSSLAGKTVSICGDSISTFTGYIPDYYSKFYPEMGEITRVEDTWWMQVLERTGMELCRNASYSGSTVSGQSQDNGDGRFACGNCRVLDLAGDEGEDPDVILILMGANDLLTDIPLGAYDGVSPVEEGYIQTFSEAYALMLDKMLKRYPETEIYCCTIAEVGRWNEAGEGYSYMNAHSAAAKDYNTWIKSVAEAKGVSVIDVYECGITAENIRQYTSDGTHPNPAGAKLIADKVCEGLGVK